MTVDPVAASRLMRETRHCVPPGHIWAGKPVGAVRPAGEPCQCGEQEYEPVDRRCRP